MTNANDGRLTVTPVNTGINVANVNVTGCTMSRNDIRKLKTRKCEKCRLIIKPVDVVWRGGIPHCPGCGGRAIET